VNEILGARLATVHNLHYYLELMAQLRAAIAGGELADFVKRFVTIAARGVTPATEDELRSTRVE